MAYHTTDREGMTELNPPPLRMRQLLRSLREEGEQPDVWLTHFETGWTLTVFTSGLVRFENEIRPDEPVRELPNISFDKALEMWEFLAQGDIQALLNEPWETSDEE